MKKMKIRKMKQSKSNQIKLGLFVKSTLIGFLLAVPSTSNTLKINDLNLDKEYAGLGYDFMLLEKAQETASEQGLSHISFEILNHEYSLYRNLGFIKEDTIIKKDGMEYVTITKKA